MARRITWKKDLLTESKEQNETERMANEHAAFFIQDVHSLSNFIHHFMFIPTAYCLLILSNGKLIGHTEKTAVTMIQRNYTILDLYLFSDNGLCAEVHNARREKT